MTQIPLVTGYPGTIPDKAVQSITEFADAVKPFMGFYHTNTVPEIIAHRTAMNTLSGEIQYVADSIAQDKLDITTMRDIVLDASNYFGDWVANYSTVENPNGYPTNCAVSFGDEIYYSKAADNQAEPTSGASDANWFYTGRRDYVLTPVKTANYTAKNYDLIPLDTLATGAFTVYFPANPSEGHKVKFIDIKGNCQAVNVALDGNGQTVMDLAEPFYISKNYQVQEFTYINGSWRITA